LREQLDTEFEELEALSELEDMSRLTHRLRQRGGAWAEVFAERETVLMAVNQEVASGDTPIKDGDEIAYFPPVTGG
jgi:molybdopterin synthase sulfur carrier subunit